MNSHDIEHLVARLRSDQSNMTIAIAAREAAEFLENVDVDHDARVTELLEHNNDLLVRARTAELRARTLEAALLSLAKVAGDIATIRMREDAP